MANSEVQYSYAIDSNGAVRHICDTAGAKPYSCGDCNRDMIARRGRKNAHHYAHIGKACIPTQDPDNFLHRLAVDKIVNGFTRSQLTGEKYLLSLFCIDCRRPSTRNIAKEGAIIEKEYSVVKGTRSDLVLIDTNAKQIIIEIVNTHDLESETYSLYKLSGIPVFKCKVTWDNVGNLDSELIADETLNREDSQNRCPPCRTRCERAKADKLKIDEAVSANIKPVESRISINPITHDKFGSPLRAHTQRKVMANARKLVGIGFEQQPKRPTLFLQEIGEWKVYADLDSTEVMRIWEVECQSALYAFRKGRTDQCKECLLQSVGGRLCVFKVPYRRHFEDTDGHSCLDASMDFQ